METPRPQAEQDHFRTRLTYDRRPLHRTNTMTIHEHLLSCLAEECAEVAQIVSKSLRFGLDDRNVLNPDGPTNRERLVAELNDLMGVATACIMHGIIPDEWEDDRAQSFKLDKLDKFIKYAREKGTIIA